MFLDDRFANRQSKTHAVGFRGEEWFEQLFARRRIESRSRIVNRNHDGIALINASPNQQRSGPIPGGGHGLDRVHDQIKYDLL